MKRSIEQKLRMNNFEARNGNYETNAVVKNQGTKQREQRTLGDCWQWKASGQCSEGDNCSFRHDMNKRSKSTQPNLSPRSSAQQSLRNASRTRSPSGKKPKWENGSTAVQGLPPRNLHQFILWKVAFFRMFVLQVRKGMQVWGNVLLCASSGWWTAWQRVQKEWWQKVQWLCWKLHDNRVAYFKIWSRRSVHRFCGRAQTYGNRSDVFDSLKPWYVMLTFKTRIHRLEWFAQVILISVTPMRQNLRIGLKNRRNGKRKVPVKQRGSWPKIS